MTFEYLVDNEMSHFYENLLKSYNGRIWGQRIWSECQKTQSNCDRGTKNRNRLKFIYSEKATKFCEIFILLLTGTT